MTTADLSPAAAKAATRSRVRAARRARSVGAREHDSAAIAARAVPILAGASVVACYLAMPTEPSTSALLDLLRQRGIRIALPRVRGASLDWVELTGDTTFTTSALGISEPDGPSLPGALSDCDAIVLPALAVSREGHRLGQGGGFYDRALESIPSRDEGGPNRITLIFDDELLDELPHEPHDARINIAITPARTFSL